MSTYYTESNDETTIGLFSKRLIYKSLFFNTQYNNLIDFNFGEKFFYGRVNRFFVPIMHTPSSIGLKQFSNTISDVSGLSGFPYVVDAFEKLAQQFQKCALLGKISNTDPYLSNLKVYKAYQDPKKLYQNFLDAQFKAIEEHLTANKIRFKNFDEFIRELMLILGRAAHRYPFTMTKFIKSKFCPINCSGLVVEIADLDPTNDDAKVNQFVNSKNWKFYVNACANYGFMVDQQAPWRLVADIGSSAMLEYAAAYGVTTTDLALIIPYKPVHNEYIKKFKFYLFNLYNQMRMKTYRVTEQCNGRTISRMVFTEKYSSEVFFRKYNDAYFMKLYFKIRFIEEGDRFTENEKSAT